MGEYYEVSEYTVEDFAQARFAEHQDTGQAACRIAGASGSAWTTEDGADATGASMARDGWVPIVDDSETIKELRRDLALAREALVDLRWENRQLEAGAEGVVSLDGLRVAWETAEVPTDENPIREGDVVIVRHGGGFAVEPADRILSGQTHGRERVLSRAPRAPWADLADALRGAVWERLSGDVDGLAAAVHAAGWRKGGEES